MSLPYYKITCSGCSFDDGCAFGINYRYEGSPEHEPVLQNAWCRDCDKIVKICIPFNRRHAQGIVFDLNARYRKSNGGLLARIFRSKKLKFEVQQNIREDNQEALEINNRLRYFETIPYKARCLLCGSNSVFHFKLPNEGLGDVESMNVEHSCGGQLLIRIQGQINPVSYTQLPKVTYNDDGILHDERKSNKVVVRRGSLCQKSLDREI